MHFSIQRMCEVLSIERSGYYAWVDRKPGKRAISNAKQSIFQYIEVYYNQMRRHSAMGSIASAVFENQYKMVA